MFHPDWSIEDYRRYLSFAVEVINHAIAGLPEDQIRFHVCWGSGHRPHVNDVPLKDIADLLVKINATAYSVEAGNVRHSHELRVWEDVKLPDGKIIVPGVVTHQTMMVEHPELVAQRITRLAGLIGREHVMAGTDCGFAQDAVIRRVPPWTQWAKLQSLVEGARIATRELWGPASTSIAI